MYLNMTKIIVSMKNKGGILLKKEEPLVKPNSKIIRVDYTFEEKKKDVPSKDAKRLRAH